LGGDGVAQLVGVDVADAGGFGDAVEHAGHGVTVEGPPVVGQQQSAGVSVGFVVPLLEQVDELGVQGDVAVVVKLADGDAQPVGVADHHHGVSFERAQFADAHAGAGQQLDCDAQQQARFGPRGAHEQREGWVVEELR
jgi:hypothetical protein